MSQVSLALDDAWDIGLDDVGGLAMVAGNARIAQDVASYERTFAGEPWYAAREGVPYLAGELGELPPPELVTSRANSRAREVPGVTDAATVLTSLTERALHGVVYVTTDEGGTLDVSI